MIDRLAVRFDRASRVCNLRVRQASIGQRTARNNLLAVSTHRRSKRSLAKCAGSIRAWYMWCSLLVVQPHATTRTALARAGRRAASTTGRRVLSVSCFPCWWFRCSGRVGNWIPNHLP
jgi:hypothetical protein